MPFYLRTGKSLARKVTEIAITLKPVPHLAFQQEGSVGVRPNQLILTMQPNEGVSLSLGAKIPGTRMRIRPVNMEFLYGTSFMSQSPEAYERLILDAMRGDATLFTRNDEVEAQWEICDPIVQQVGGDARAAAAVRGGHAGPGRGRPAARGRRALARDLGVDAMATVDTVWRAQDTNPGDIDAALRAALSQIHRENAGYVPARVLNLVCVVDKQYSGEIANRLRRVGRYHPSRTIVCSVDPKRTTLDAVATIAAPSEVREGDIGLLRETVVVECGDAAPQAPRPHRRPAGRHRPADRACGRRTATTRPSTRCWTSRRSC